MKVVGWGYSADTDLSSEVSRGVTTRTLSVLYEEVKASNFVCLTRCHILSLPDAYMSIFRFWLKKMLVVIICVFDKLGYTWPVEECNIGLKK